MRNFFRFLVSKTFVINLVIALLAFLLMLWLINFGLGKYTHHGEQINVPNLAAMPLDDAEVALTKVSLTYEVIDSANFNDLFPPLSVIDQHPKANAAVKKGRVIKLTINPARARKVEVPDVVEKTTRRAIHFIESRGFTIGQLIYVPDIARDRVLGVRVGDEEIETGTRLEPGTTLDLIVGKGLSQERIKVPYLKFKTLDEAQSQLAKASLNLGVVFFDEEVKDSASAIVYKQSPYASLKPSLKLGSDVDLWLTEDYTKIKNDSLLFQPMADTVVTSAPNIDTEQE